MKVFLDVKIVGFRKDNTQAVSIALVAEDGESFYGEIEYPFPVSADDWEKENILNHLSKSSEHLKTFADKTVKGKPKDVSNELNTWLSLKTNCTKDIIKLVGDACYYDFVFLMDFIVGDASDIPENISSVYHDINYDMAIYFGISEAEALTKDREEILKEINKTIAGDKYTAMYDAKRTKEIFECLIDKVERSRNNENILR